MAGQPAGGEGREQSAAEGGAGVTALPRGRCPICGQTAALRRNGVLREHYVYRPQAEQDQTTPLGRMRVCEGSGRPPA